MNIGTEINDTVEYLGRRGIEFLPTPTFVFVDELCPYNPGLYTRLNQKLKEILIEGVDAQLKGIFGEQNIKKLEQKISGSRIPEEKYEENIIFYRPFQELGEGYKKSIIVEEVWHFVEAEKNVSHKLICEGTAKYGAHCLTNVEIPEKRLSCFHIVKREMEKHVNIFKAMLEPDVRARIEEKYVRKLKKEGIREFMEAADELLSFSP